MNRVILASLFLAVFPCLQAQEESPEKPKQGFVRIINASTISLSEAWKAGVDLSFKDQVLARDMRGGEGAAYTPITFVGKDTVDVMPTGKTSKVGTVPAAFEAGGFYTILLTGAISDDGFKVTPVVSTDFPVPPAKVRQGYARIRMFNAITTFPVRLKMEEDGTVASLPPLAFTELYLKPGAHSYRLIFPYKEQTREIQGLFMVNANTEYTAVIFASPGRPNRPVSRLWDNSEQMRDALEAVEAAKKDTGESPEKPPEG